MISIQAGSHSSPTFLQTYTRRSPPISTLHSSLKMTFSQYLSTVFVLSFLHHTILLLFSSRTLISVFTTLLWCALLRKSCVTILSEVFVGHVSFKMLVFFFKTSTYVFSNKPQNLASTLSTAFRPPTSMSIFYFSCL